MEIGRALGTGTAILIGYASAPNIPVELFPTLNMVEIVKLITGIVVAVISRIIFAKVDRYINSKNQKKTKNEK